MNSKKNKYVKYSKETAKLNPDMIKDSYLKLIGQCNDQIRSITSRFDNGNVRIVVPDDAVIREEEYRDSIYDDKPNKRKVIDVPLKDLGVLRDGGGYSRAYRDDFKRGIDYVISKIFGYDDKLAKLQDTKKEIDAEYQTFKHQYGRVL